MLEINKLPIGKSMDRDLFDDHGNLLIASGTELSEALIESLKRRGIEKLVVEAPGEEVSAGSEEFESPSININQLESFLSEHGIEPAVSDFVRHKCSEALSNCFTQLEGGGIADVLPLEAVAQEITEQILSNSQVALTLADLILVDPGLHAHSVNVMILFLMMSRAMGHPVKLIHDHSTAALMHDIGRIILRAQNPKKSPTDIDLEHSEAGYNYLWNLGNISDSALKMVMNHHERYDGHGYPRKIKGTMLSDWDQILILANTYDNLTWDRGTGMRSGFHTALSSIIMDGAKAVRKGIIRAAIQTFGHYPPGSWVKLNNGEIGLVTSAHPGSPLKPTITVVYDSLGRRHSKPKFLDLTHTQSTYIVGPVAVQTRT
jgi:hypothetical protein